jgi:tRNA 5-methylaminomethyl-2-thiouridine biosynthesis bifunctional protein
VAGFFFAPVKTQPISPARISFREEAPFAPDFGDVYHARAGALAQARYVFLGGNGLPQRWCRRERFVILETGFGLGNNFLATWAAWREDPQRCERLVFVSVEKHPPLREDLDRAHAGSPLKALADHLVAAWPPLTHNLHPLDFEGGRLKLLLALGDAADWLPELMADVDAFYLDGFAPARNPRMWERRLFKALARLAAPQATAATWSVAREVRDGLAEAGFVVERAPGFAAKGEMSVARYAPSFTPRRSPSRRIAPSGERKALVIGGGLAGASVAQALRDEGFACTVLDRCACPAGAASGNAAGLFHGIVTPEDGAHARFNRAAALLAQRAYASLVSTQGLLRLEHEHEAAAMQALLQRLGLPGDYVQALDAARASALAGLRLHAPAWYYPGGGSVVPAAVVEAGLAAASWIGEADVASLRSAGGRWQALAADGRVLAEAPVVVLANAGDAARLLDVRWPLQSVRGQVSLVRSDIAPRLPIAGAGYAIDLGEGRLLCGATQQPGDDDAEVRDRDHAANLEQLAGLLGRRIERDALVSGRVGWRCSADDRLPVLGPVPMPSPAGSRLEQPRFVARRPGLFVLTALGSRGLTWAPLAGRTLAAWIAGAPLPVEASLLDRVDAARFVSRAARALGPQRDQPPPSAR